MHEKKKGGSSCERIQELIVWYPGGMLREEERDIVEKHLAACAECSELMGFVSSVKTHLQLEAGRRLSDHPEAALLVEYVEDRQSLSEEKARYIANHLEICPSCRKEADMLEEIESEPPEESKSTVSELRRFDLPAFLGRIFLSPAAAIAYMAVAVIAIGLYLSAPGTRPGTSTIETIRLGGISIPANEIDRGRRAGGDEFPRTLLERHRDNFVLIEFTSLDSPPAETAVYRIQITLEDTGEPVFERTITGSEFSENYTLILMLESGSLSPGDHVLQVLDPDDRTIFISRLTLRE